MKTIQRTKVAAGVALVIGIGTGSAGAAPLTMTWTGLLTVLNSQGSPVANGYSYDQWDGNRAPLSGSSLQFDLDTGTGSAYAAFDFWGTPSNLYLTIEPIGDGAGNPGPLLLVNGSFNTFYGSTGIPVSFVWDASGLLASIADGVITYGETVSGIGALPASNGILNGAYSIGPAPLATTGWDTSTINCIPGGGNTGDCMGEPVTGGLPLLTGATYTSGPLAGQMIGGSPMVAGPMQGYSLNLDITSVTFNYVDCLSCPPDVPLPAAAWLFGSGLLGLLGAARRRSERVRVR